MKRERARLRFGRHTTAMRRRAGGNARLIDLGSNLTKTC
jgi:hypothetical protein